MKLPEQCKIKSDELLIFKFDSSMDLDNAIQFVNDTQELGIPALFMPDGIELVNRPISESFETWYEQEGKDFENHKEACRIAWENGAYTQQTK